MKRIMLVFGIHPETIKMYSMVKEFQNHPEDSKTIVCMTGQHPIRRPTEPHMVTARDVCAYCGDHAK